MAIQSLTLLAINYFFTSYIWFLPRDAMRKRGLCCHICYISVTWRLSVRHVHVLYPNGWRYRQTSFSTL